MIRNMDINEITEKIFNGERVRRVSPGLEKGAIKKLDMINLVTGLEQYDLPDLPPVKYVLPLLNLWSDAERQAYSCGMCIFCR